MMMSWWPPCIYINSTNQKTPFPWELVLSVCTHVRKTVLTFVNPIFMVVRVISSYCEGHHILKRWTPPFQCNPMPVCPIFLKKLLESSCSFQCKIFLSEICSYLCKKVFLGSLKIYTHFHAKHILIFCAVKLCCWWSVELLCKKNL